MTEVGIRQCTGAAFSFGISLNEPSALYMMLILVTAAQVEAIVAIVTTGFPN